MRLPWRRPADDPEPAVPAVTPLVSPLGTVLFSPGDGPGTVSVDAVRTDAKPRRVSARADWHGVVWSITSWETPDGAAVSDPELRDAVLEHLASHT